jgi:hypothetical protein
MDKRLVSIIAAAIFLAGLISGCTVRLVPSKIPPLDIRTEGLAGPFNNITVSVVNVQTDESDLSVKDMKGRDTGWVLSRKLWTEKLAEALRAELQARQANVVSGAPVTIYLKIMDVAYTSDTTMMTIIQFDVTSGVGTNSGWKKKYVGRGDASAWVPAGTTEDKNWNRAANWAIRGVVLKIMSDPEFIAVASKEK